ncbi:MAG: methylenetetrahydrofolate reductase [NAD(P)H] [Phycisphaerales bacterium]|nr:methylenetetrahydrofolate reductase [NAD(P)H] [Phycisphaerales bacterium]
MHIADIFQRDSTTFSFEFFPPKTAEAWDELFERISDFESLGPSFVSVTYGAGGSTRERTHELVVKLKSQGRLDPVPHLTTVGHTHDEVREILERYSAVGVSNIMALRGDTPRDLPGYNRAHDEFKYAADLVKLIRQFNGFGEHKDRRGFGIGVAGFPEGHPETANCLKLMDHLKAKVDSGADYICSQMFFHNPAFYDWCERCELAGIKKPLVAGIMPITSIGGMKRMAELSGCTNFPARLLKNIYQRQDDPEAVKKIGIHWATEQCRDLIDRGVRGIHFYTLNRSDATMQIYQTLALAPQRQKSTSQQVKTSK